MALIGKFVVFQRLEYLQGMAGAVVSEEDDGEDFHFVLSLILYAIRKR